MQVGDLRPDQDVMRVEDRPSRAFLLVEGFATGSKLTPGRQRQMLALPPGCQLRIFRACN
jgi:hypothetical protein